MYHVCDEHFHEPYTANPLPSPRPMTSPAAIADRLMDATIVPGFTSLGYRVRSRSWEPAPDLSGRAMLDHRRKLWTGRRGL